MKPGRISTGLTIAFGALSLYLGYSVLDLAAWNDDLIQGSEQDRHSMDDVLTYVAANSNCGVTPQQLADAMNANRTDGDSPFEVVRLDDGSVEVLHLRRNLGHQRAIAIGLAYLEAHSTCEAVVVMDGDLQHPPELVPALVEAGNRSGADVVVASRHVAGGSDDGLASGARVLVSSLSTWLSKAMFPSRLRGVSDPMSGFFAIRPGAIDLRVMKPPGFKVLLELLVRSPGLRKAEVPFVFGDRQFGESKASLREGMRFGFQLCMLSLSRVGRRLRPSPTGLRAAGLSRQKIGYVRSLAEDVLSGRLDFDNLPEDKRAALRGKRIGMVFQDPLTSLNPLYRIGDQLVETIRAHRSLSRPAATELAVSLLDRVGIVLTEEALTHEENAFPLTFLARALENTDKRIDEGRPVTPFFLFAVLLWEPVRRRAEVLEQQGMGAIEAIRVAADEICAQQLDIVALPRRFSTPMREIWQLLLLIAAGV